MYSRHPAGKSSSSQSNMRYLVAFRIKTETIFYYLEENAGDVFFLPAKTFIRHVRFIDARTSNRKEQTIDQVALLSVEEI